MNVPERMAHLPRRGRFVVGHMFGVDANGVPDFTVLDEAKVLACVRDSTCGLCGEPIDYWFTFVGGPLSVANRSFLDPAMHEECARYALSVCPFLLGQHGYAERPARPGLHRDDEPAIRPDRFALYVTRGFRVRHGVILALPAKRIEWFVHGEPHHD